MNKAKSVLDFTAKCLEFIACICLLIMVFCASWQVICRFILKVPCVWTEEYAKLGYITLVLIMWPVLEHLDGQLKVIYFFKKLPMFLKTVLFFIINLSYLAFIVLFFFSACKAMIISWDLAYSAIKWMNSGIQYIPALVSMPFAFIFVVARMFNYKEEINKHDEFDIDLEEES